MLSCRVTPTLQQISADFDGDRGIDGAGFLAWQRGFAATSGAERANGDSDTDSDVDASDLAAWTATYGEAETPYYSTASGLSVYINTLSPIRAASSRV